MPSTYVYPPSLLDALPISEHYDQIAHFPTSFRAKTSILIPELNLYYLAVQLRDKYGGLCPERDRKSTRLNSSHITNSYAVVCLQKKTILRCAECCARARAR